MTCNALRALLGWTVLTAAAVGPGTVVLNPPPAAPSPGFVRLRAAQAPAAPRDHLVTMVEPTREPALERCPVGAYRSALRQVTAMLRFGTMERAGGEDRVVAHYEALYGSATCCHLCNPFGSPGERWTTRSERSRPLLLNGGDGSTGTRFLNCVMTGLHVSSDHNSPTILNESCLIRSGQESKDCTAAFDPYDYVSDTPVPYMLAPLLRAFRGNVRLMLSLRDPWEWAERRLAAHAFEGAAGWVPGDGGCHIRQDNRSRLGDDREAAALNKLTYDALALCLGAREGLDPVLINLFDDADDVSRLKFGRFLGNASLDQKLKETWRWCHHNRTQEALDARLNPMLDPIVPVPKWTEFLADPKRSTGGGSGTGGASASVATAVGGTAGHAVLPQVRFLLMTSCVTIGRLGQTPIGHCTAESPCLAYTEVDSCDADSAVRWPVRLVRPREYLPATPPMPPASCCDPTVKNPGNVKYARSLGPNAFFCGPHHQKTLAAQFRFLPALAHGRSQYRTQLELGTVGWLALMDDDSYVRPFLLRQALARYREDVPLQLGDFVPTPHSRGSAVPMWLRPFGCGGSGSIFSRAATLRSNWSACAEHMANTCSQSDWMVSACAARHGVLAVEDASCHACGLYDGMGPYGVERLIKSLEGQCAFAQYTMPTRAIRAMFANWTNASLAQRFLSLETLFAPAIVHVQDHEDRRLLDKRWRVEPMVSRGVLSASPRVEPMVSRGVSSASPRHTVAAATCFYVPHFGAGSKSNASRGLEILLRTMHVLPPSIQVLLVGDAKVPADALATRSKNLRHVRTSFLNITQKLSRFLSLGPPLGGNESESCTASELPNECSKRLGLCTLWRVCPHKFLDYKPFLPLLFPCTNCSCEYSGWLDSDLLLSGDRLETITSELTQRRISLLRVQPSQPWYLSWGPISLLSTHALDVYVRPWLQEPTNAAIIKTALLRSSHYTGFDEWGTGAAGESSNTLGLAHSFSGLMIRLAAAEPRFVVGTLDNGSEQVQYDDPGCFDGVPSAVSAAADGTSEVTYRFMDSWYAKLGRKAHEGDCQWLCAQEVWCRGHRFSRQDSGTCWLGAGPTAVSASTGNGLAENDSVRPRLLSQQDSNLYFNTSRVCPSCDVCPQHGSGYLIDQSGSPLLACHLHFRKRYHDAFLRMRNSKEVARQCAAAGAAAPAGKKYTRVVPFTCFEFMAARMKALPEPTLAERRRDSYTYYAFVSKLEEGLDDSCF